MKPGNYDRWPHQLGPTTPGAAARQKQKLDRQQPNRSKKTNKQKYKTHGQLETQSYPSFRRCERPCYGNNSG
ncbi:MAG: hypothetical protein DRO11_01370 [Methanobacteriota archaeon]|nr:MAG: hypothetical protein DRO11_01370 [Euryarchaeota archaeon]